MSCDTALMLHSIINTELTIKRVLEIINVNLVPFLWLVKIEAKKPTRVATIVVCITRSCWSSCKWVKKSKLRVCLDRTYFAETEN